VENDAAVASPTWSLRRPHDSVTDSDWVAGIVVEHSGADCLDRSDALVSQHHWRWVCGVPLPEVNVGTTDTGQLDADDQLSRGGLPQPSLDKLCTPCFPVEDDQSIDALRH